MRSLTLLTLLLATGFPLLAPAASPPNILLILVDDMGYGDLKSYNAQSKIPTPHLDRLAQDGMRFTDAHASGPLCHVSRYGLMTGRFPFRADTGSWRTKPSIEKGQLTVASLLKGKGYQTAMVGKWHLGFHENGYDKPMTGGPVDVGFESYFGIRASTDIPPYFYIRGDRAVHAPTNKINANNSEGWSRIQGAFWRAGGIAPNLKLEDVLPRFTDEAIGVLEKRDNSKPLFLYLAYPAPHTPWLPSKEFKGKSGAGMYGDFMAMVDHEIGRVLKKLDDARMTDDTLVIFSSDNGPVWYDKDVERTGHDSSGGLRGMKADAWEGGHRMPFLVRWPGKVRPSSTSNHLVCFTDLLATFGDLVDAELPASGLDSENFLPVLTGSPSAKHPPRAPIVMKSGGGTMMIRDGDWKLIDRLGSGGFSQPRKVVPGPGDPPGQLYNLSRDPSEAKNLWKEHPETVARLSALMRKIVAE